MENNKLIEPVEIGDYVKVYNKKGCGAMGYLIGCTELLSNGNIVKMYTIMIDNNKYIDICEDDMHISVNRRADSADIGVTFPEPSAYNSAQTACFY